MKKTNKVSPLARVANADDHPGNNGSFDETENQFKNSKNKTIKYWIHVASGVVVGGPACVVGGGVVGGIEGALKNQLKQEKKKLKLGKKIKKLLFQDQITIL